MSWSEVSPGRFERPYDVIEGFYITLLKPSEDDPEYREHWLVTVAAKVQFERSEDEAISALKNAWKTLRYDHPELACTIEGQRKIYQAADNRIINEWLAETFIIRPSTTADELLAMPKPNRLAMCYFLPQTSEIAIVSSHWRIDGVGSLQLMGNFLKAVAEGREVVFGKEGKNLSHGIFKALRAPDGDPSAEADQAASDLVSIMWKNFPSIGLPIPPQRTSTPGFTRRISRSLSVAATAAFKAACKARNLSPTAATHAALAQAVYSLSSQPSNTSTGQTAAAKKYISWALVDLRPYTQPATTSPTHPITNYHGGLPVALDPQVPFDDNARYLTEIYWHSWTTPFALPPAPTSTNVSPNSSQPPHSESTKKPTLLEILHPYIRKTVSALLTPPPPSTPEPTHPTYSSLGVLDRYIQPAYTSTSTSTAARSSPGSSPGSGSGTGDSDSEHPGAENHPPAAAATVRVHDAWIGVETATGAWQRQPVVHVWVWRGRMGVGVCFDGGWVPEGVVAGLVEGVFGVLGREMGVEVDYYDGNGL